MSDIDSLDPDFFTNRFATLTTLGAGGDPQSTIVWFLVENGTIVISATARRRKTKNLAADPRCSVLITHPDTADYYVEIRGTAEVIDDSEYTIADRISPRYNADFRSFDSPTDRRTAIIVRADRVVVTDVRSH
ncbi:MAG TPA: PPOX class F420-dependent oxidoreductase [Ilumatobacteraceae bacterium]